MKNRIKTEAQILKAIKEVKKTNKDQALLIDGLTGLEIRIRHSASCVTASFRHRYTDPTSKKRRYMTLGQFPAISLIDALKIYADNQALLAKKIDPLEERKQQQEAEAAAINNGFSSVAQQWLEYNLRKQPKAGTIASWQRGIKLAVKAWGDTPIKNINAPMVLKLCSNIQKEMPNTGKRLRSLIDRIFSFAVARGMIDTNPAKEIAGQLIVPRVQHQPAITNPMQFGQLIKDINAMPDSYERTALLLMALLFTRSGDMVAARWCDIDLPNYTWILRPEKGESRADMINELVIPLPRQAVKLLEDQHKITGHSDYVFYTAKGRSIKHIRNRRLSKALSELEGGKYAGKHVPHGFRASAITMIQEQLGFARELPDLQAGHVIKDTNGAAYNRAKFIKERREMLQVWADYIDKLKAGNIDNVIHASFKQRPLRQG